MNETIEWSASARTLGLALVFTVLAGCAAKSPAPVRHATTPPVEVAQSGTAVAVSGMGTVREHLVQPGDTLMGIGRLYGRSVQDLIAWNGLLNPNQLSPNQRLLVAPPGGPAGAPVAIARPVQVIPVLPQGEVAQVTPLRQEPRGGTQPYSDQALASVRPDLTSPLAPPSVPAASTDTGWAWPTRGALLAGFNEATNKGIDIAGNPGDPVLASAGGKVVYSGSGLRGYGKLVIIKHDESYLTAYAHNQELLVKEGDAVSRGQKIAELGSTDADRPKLHFEIRKQGRPVDPMGYLPPR